MARRKVFVVGTTILGLLNREGILIAGDSLSWKLKAKQANPRNEIKVHRIGGDPGYILLAISGSNFMTDHVLVTLRNSVNEEHKKGRVMTSGGCARHIYYILNTDLNELEASSYSMPKDVDYNTFECGVLVAMFEPDLRNVCAVRRPGLYLASAEDWDKIDEFEIDGTGYERAFDAISPSYACDKEMEDAIVQVEEGMLAASKSGGSGGIITIDRINQNNLIENVSRKPIEQLQRESDEREQKRREAAEVLRKEIEQSQRESDEREQKRREEADVLRSGAGRSQLSKQAKKRKKEIGTSNRIAKKQKRN